LHVFDVTDVDVGFGAVGAHFDCSLEIGAGFLGAAQLDVCFAEVYEGEVGVGLECEAAFEERDCVGYFSALKVGVGEIVSYGARLRG
jgi:hypothetical protein